MKPTLACSAGLLCVVGCGCDEHKASAKSAKTGNTSKNRSPQISTSLSYHQTFQVNCVKGDGRKQSFLKCCFSLVKRIS